MLISLAFSHCRAYPFIMEKVTVVEQDFDYFLVLDFEATCIKDMRINPQEIIEFPCLKVHMC